MALGVGRHNDPGVLTMLAQDDVGGLEVKRKRDGEWIRVKPVPDSYVVNVGNVTQVYSRARCWSTDTIELSFGFFNFLKRSSTYRFGAMRGTRAWSIGLW